MEPRNCHSSVYIPGTLRRQGPAPAVPDHELIRCIGRGSYGAVWLARNVMGGFRAVKVIHRGSFDSDRPYEREFSGIQHFEPISRCHESQVDILHVGRNEAAGYFYYIMELADDAAGASRTVAAAGIDPENYEPATLKAMRERGRLPFRECLRLALSLTTALGHLHRHGLVHRDVKPSNIVFINGAPKLVDIGLVARADATCSFVGTEGYLPPEGPGTPQADLYSLGKVLYEAGIGEDRRDFPKWPATWDCPEEEKDYLELNAVVLKACKRNPRERYQTAEQMHAELVLLQAGKSIRRTHQLERRLAAAWRFGMVVTAAGILAVAGYVWAAHQNRLVTQHLARAEAERNRAEQSEVAVREELRNSLLYEARALRQSGQAGQRFEALAALARAAAIRPGPDLRTEAVACMRLMDVRESGDWKLLPVGTYGWTFDPKHELYAWSDQEGNVSIRRLADDLEAAFLPGFGQRAWIEQFSPDSRFFAAKYHPPERWHRNEFYVWEVGRKEKVLELPGGIYHEAFAFSPDGAFAAAGLAEGVILLTDLTTRREISRFPIGFEPNSLSLSPGGKWLAASSTSGEVHIFDPMTPEAVQSFAHSRRTRGIAWHPEGKLLAVPCDDGLIYLWNTETGRRASVLSGHQAEVLAARFSQNGQWLASRSWDGTVRVWDAARSRPLLAFPQREFIQFDFGLDDSRLGPFRNGPRLGLWELVAPEEAYRPAGMTIPGLNSASLSPDQSLLACSSSTGISLWDMASARQIARLSSAGARAVAFLAEGQLLTGEKGLALRSITAGAGVPWHLETPSSLWGNAAGGDCDELASSRCGRKIVARSGSDEAVLIDRDAGTGPVFLEGHPKVRYVAMSPGGEWAATGTLNGRDVGIWETGGGQLLELLPMAGGARVAFSPDGNWLIVNSERACSFVETGSWKVRHRLRTPDGDADEAWVGRVVFSADGLLLAISRSPGTIHLVQTRSAELLMNLEALIHRPIGFLAGGNSLLVYGQRGELFLWDLRLIRRQLAQIGLDWEAPEGSNAGLAALDR